MRFLRPELEKLHARLHAVSTMRGAGVSVDAVDWEMGYAQSQYTGADRQLYPGLLLPYLAEHTPPPASVLYVGGGGGRATVSLLEAGYQVTVLMPAATGLRLVHKEAGAAGVAAQLSCVCGYAADASALGEGAFDAVVALQSIRVEQNLRAVLTVLLRVSRKVLCFDVMSRYGFLVGRMPGGYQWTAGYTPASMLYVLAEHETPGGRPSRHERYPLYTFDETSALAGEVGLEVDTIEAVDAQEVFQWQDDPNEAAGAELARRIQEDDVLRELALGFLVLGRKPAGQERVPCRSDS